MVKTKPRFKSKAGRIKNPKKNDRWAKGDSCLSNPETRKFRDEASSLYFHGAIKNPLLTARNLEGRYHPGKDDIDIDDDVLSADVQSLTVSDARTGHDSFASYKTFASDWSKCSNGAFEKFLGRFKLESALHKEMLSILAATTEVINSLGGTHRETEYFASFLTALDQCESSQYPAMMALLSIVSGRVPEGVLRKTFPAIYPKIAFILNHAMDNFDNSLMRVTCDVLKKILGAQDSSVFETELPVQTLIYGILRCALHDNPKVRRKARTTVGFILSRQKEKGGNDTMAKIVLGWILDQLATFPTCGSKSAGDAIGLLQFVWSNLDSVSTGGAKKLYESVLRVMSSGDMSLVKIGFSFFSVVFQTQLITTDSSSKPEVGFTPKLITALWDFRPDWRNNEAFLLWLHCILNGLIRLSEDDSTLAGPYISQLLESIAPTWTSDWGRVPTKVFVDYLFHLVRPETGHDDIESSFQVISKNLISVPPNEHCLAVLSGFLDTLKLDQFTISGREVLLQLLQLRLSSAARKVNALLGQFVKSFGIDNLWISVDSDIRLTVILPLIRENLSGASFSYWKEHIFPLHKFPHLVPDVWSSLVGFCRDPIDPENFPAMFVGETGIKTAEFRLVALAALRQLATWPQAKGTLEKHGLKFLTILFNEYIAERQSALAAKDKRATGTEKRNYNPGHSDAIGTTIQEYLPHLDPKLIQDLLQMAIKKFNGGSKEEKEREGEKGPILDLVAFLSVFEMDAEAENHIFKIASSLVSDEVHMKRAYRLLQSLLNNESLSPETRTQIVEVLRESKVATKSNAEPLRLECLISLGHQNDSWLVEFLPEAILSLLSVNTRARNVAIKYVAKVCESLKAEKITLDEIQPIVKRGLECTGLDEKTKYFIISCTIHFLRQLYLHSPPATPDESLINNCINHLLDKDVWDSGVSRETLTFLSRNLSIFKTRMGPFAPRLGQLIAMNRKTSSGDGESCGFPRKEMNKILGKMIRVFGVAGLKAVLPNSDDPKMSNRIKNIQRKIRKMKESKTAALKKGDEEEESDEEDEEEGKGGRRNSHTRPTEKLIIKEGVVDFLDPKNMTASLISKPKEVKAGDEFKVSSDGKLIIEDLDGRRGKKRGLEEDLTAAGGGSDEDEDDELVGKRRKKTRTGSVMSHRTNKSGSTKKSGRSSSGMSMKSKSTNNNNRQLQTHHNRPQLKAKRSKKGGSSNQSVKSGRSGKSRGQKEGFNYKR